MAGQFAPTGRGFAEALPMTSGYFAVILRSHGQSAHTAAALFEGTALDESTLPLHSEITLGQQLRQIRNTAQLLDPSWALGVGSQLTPASHGPNGIASVCAPSLRHGLQIMARYAHLRAPHFRFRSLQLSATEVRIVYEDRVALTALERRALLELVMLSTQSLIETMLGRPMEEGRFELPYAAPEHARTYNEVFHAPVFFARPQAAVVLPARWLELESPFADRPLQQAALTRVQLSARRLHGDRLLVARVEQLLARRGARLGLEQAARLLGVSDRTLGRRLHSQGTSYHALVDESLQHQAIALLLDHELSIGEVAFALGYRDAANFGRAFRRWFGQSPGRFRATIDPASARTALEALG